MKEFKLTASADNLDLAVALITPPEGVTIRGVLQVVHGMVEHKERYYAFMKEMASHGYVCIIHDHRGHGSSVKSQRDLGYMYEGGWLAMVNDVKIVGDWARNEYKGQPFTLFGHSMGSMVVRSYAKRYDSTIDKLFVCGCPSFNAASGFGKILARAYGLILGWHYRPRLLQHLSFGSYNKPFKSEGWKSAWVCSDPDTLAEYHSNPLCQYVFTANGFYNLLGLMQDCYSLKGWKMEKPQMPVHFISGAQDACRISDKAIADAADLMRRAGYADVDLKLFEGMRHEILMETHRELVYDYILKRL